MLFDKIVSREPVLKGWSADKKYKAVTEEGEVCLLRISPEEHWQKVCDCYRRMKDAMALGISMCHPLEYGRCAEGIYFIQSWIEGSDAESVMGSFSPEVQYACGLAAGRDLKKLHALPAPGDAQPWSQRYGRKIDRKLKLYSECPEKYDDDSCILEYIRQNRRLIHERPVCYQHGDHHIGNMMIGPDGMPVLIDFEKEDYGDPWEEFNRIVWSAQAAPYFASGTLDGYFGQEIPEQFWRLLLLYISTNTLSSLPWAVPFGAEEIRVMKEQQRQVMIWYDHMKRIVPSWYRRPVYLRPILGTDREQLARLYLDPVVGRTYMVPEGLDITAASRLADRITALSARKDRYVRAVCVGEKAVGVIHDVEITDGSLELGWAIRSEYHGQGIGTEALGHAIKELPGLGFRRVTAGAFEYNIPSIRVMEKNGMVPMDKEEQIPYRGQEYRCVYYCKDLEEQHGG